MKHASIIPLIGGETIASERAFGAPPEYFLSFEPFWSNDQHIVNYYNNEIPYHVLDKGERPSSKVDVVSSVCPCAGLSQLSHGYGEDAPANDWMPKAAEYVLGELKPEVYWGENAPAFSGKIGTKVRNKLRAIGKENGYVMSSYRTRSLLHGIPQVRERAFYFFWKGDRIPLLNYFKEKHQPIEDLILGVKANSFMEVINKKTPSKDDPYYRFILEEIHGGVTHREFSTKILEPMKARGNDALSYIELQGYNYDQVGEWMGKNGYDREVEKCAKRKAKLEAGGNLMRRGTVVPKDYIGAFVGHYPTCLTHPVEDRYITYREAMSIMGLPENFELINPKKNVNHICQNVPVKTAQDMATEVREYLLGNRPTIKADYIYQHNHSQTHTVEGALGASLSEFI
jgi:site-specific DNA-cytosine methylase